MNNVSFSMSSCMLDPSVNRRSVKPNKDGIYEKICMMVLGEQPSQNGKIYEPSSMLDALTNPNGCCRKKLTAGGLVGEFSHPFVLRDEEISRIATIDMARASHVVVKLYTGETTEKGNTPVYGDIVPYGPYKDHVREALESPVLNAAFSLRSLVEKIGQTPEGYIKQRVMALISFDFVDCGGYRAAAKVAPESAVEDYQVPIRKENASVLRHMVSQEVITDAQLEDILGMDKVTLLRDTFEVNGQALEQNGRSVDVFHTLFNR